MRKLVLSALVSLLLSTAVIAGLVGCVAALPAETIIVPDHYPKIQWAIGNASEGDTIFVKARTYYEHVVVYKPLTLVGEAKSTTIIDGSGIGIVVRSNASDVEIAGFTVQNGGAWPYSGIQIASCVRNTIRDNIIRNNGLGIELFKSNDSVIAGNEIVESSWAGIYVRDSNYNEIHANIIVDNAGGVWVTSHSSTFNKFYHNNFISNINHARSDGLNTKWDNGAEGNYWDNYIGNDTYSGPYQNETGSDGIGDTPYTGIMGGVDEDEYPLWEPWSLLRTFSIPWNGETYYVTTICNSTIASFKFNQSLAQISFNVTGPSGATSFCNVTIPNRLLWGSFTVFVNGELVDFIPTANATHNSFNFTIELQSTSKVQIRATEVVSELPSWTSILLVLVAFTAFIALHKRTPPKKPLH